MSLLYVVDHGAVIGVDAGHITVKHQSGDVDTIPKNTVESNSIYSNAVITEACINHCLVNDIRVSFFASNGKYRGCLRSAQYENLNRLRNQFRLSEDKVLCLKFAKNIISAKINNQMVVAKRYCGGSVCLKEFKLMKIAQRKISEADSVERITGLEGLASRMYFRILSSAIEDDFTFEYRARRPARDPFNCMLNIGYSLLTKEIYGVLESRSLNPYIGIVHKGKHGHPALASDLIEEWRAVIVDSAVLSLVQGHEISIDEFELDNGRCQIKPSGMKKLISKLEQKMEDSSRYLAYYDRKMTYREAIWHQADIMSRVVDRQDPSIYKPVRIR